MSGRLGLRKKKKGEKLAKIMTQRESPCTCSFLHVHDLLANRLANLLAVLVPGLVPHVVVDTVVVVVVGTEEEDRDVGWR